MPVLRACGVPVGAFVWPVCAVCELLRCVVHPQEGEQDLVAQEERKQRQLEKKKAMKAVADAESAARARGLGSGLVVAEGQDFEFVGTGLVGAVTTAAGKEGAAAGAGAGAYFLSHPCTSACTHIRLFLLS